MCVVSVFNVSDVRIHPTREWRCCVWHGTDSQPRTLTREFLLISLSPVSSKMVSIMDKTSIGRFTENLMSSSVVVVYNFESSKWID